MPLPSVTIDIVGQNYKKGAEVNIKIGPLPSHSIHLAKKFAAHVAKRIGEVFKNFIYIYKIFKKFLKILEYWCRNYVCIYI